MIKFITDNGIVINKQDFGEADRYITVFTENFGRITFLIKGIRKSKKRELSSVDILNLSKITFYKKGDSYVVSTLQSIDSYLEIKEKLESLEPAIYITAILNEILVENNRKKRLFEISLKTFDFLKKSKENKVNYILLAYFLYYIIKDEGLKIAMGEGNRFSFEKSTFIIDGEENFIYKLNQEEKNILERIVQNRIKEIINGEYSSKGIINVIYLLENYINFHLGTKIKLKNYITGVEND